MKMEFRIFILSLACLCCLTPPALGSILALKAVAAVGAVKGAALLGAGALAVKGAAIKGAAVKGAAVKGAAILAAKAAAVKGAAAILAAKGAAVKGAAAILAAKGAAVKAAAVKGAAAILAAKGAAVKGALALAAKAASVAVHKLPAVRPPVIVRQPAAITFTVPVVAANTIAVKTHAPLPPVLSSLSSLWSSRSVVQHKIDAVGNAIESLQPETVIAPVISAPVIYEVPEPTRFYPLLRRVEGDCL